MRILYHYWLCPFSRKIRLILSEKKLDFNLELEKIWEKRPEFIKINPAGSVPVLSELNGSIISDSYAITEYLEEAYPDATGMLGRNMLEKAEIRRLTAWFDDKFAREVSLPLLNQKIYIRFKNAYRDRGQHLSPDSSQIRQAKHHIHEHLEYISWLVDRRKWLGGDSLSAADLSAAAHLSSVDYLGDVPWDQHRSAKEWYACIKSRPSFRDILSERLSGLLPASHYADLDF